MADGNWVQFLGRQRAPHYEDKHQIVTRDNPLPVTNYGYGTISIDNSSTTLLTNGSSFTGEWEDVGHFPHVSVAVKTDQNGTFSVQFSPDGINQDSTLTRRYRTNQIEAPHVFVITRRYCRVVFTNDSGSDQTYFRLDTEFGLKGQLNAPLDSILAQDFDAIATRPSDYKTEVSLGKRQGHDPWDEFGYNLNVSTGAPELVASFGGAMSIYTTASTYTVTSTGVDTNGGTGCNSVIIYGVDENWNFAIEVVPLDSTTPPVTATAWLSYPNRVAMYLCGTGQVNANDINVTRTTGGATVGQIPVGIGTSQQVIFTVALSYKFAADWLLLNASKQSGGNNPKVTFRMWVYSNINNGKQLVLNYNMDTSIEVDRELSPVRPFPIGEKSIIWIEAITDSNNTVVGARFSGEAYRDADA